MESKNYYDNLRYEMLEFLPPASSNILEIGCGMGNFGHMCKKKYNAYVVGIEMNEQMGQIAKEKLDEVLIGDANKKIEILPNNKFDLVICNDILEHIYQPKLFIQKMKSKITHNATLVFSLPNFRYFPNIKHILFDKDFKYNENGGILDQTHLTFFTKRSITNFFKEQELHVERIKGINEPKRIKAKLIKPFLKIIGHGDMMFLQFAVVCKI